MVDQLRKSLEEIGRELNRTDKHAEANGPDGNVPAIAIISLAEAGNLGDDLILLATISAINQALPRVRIRCLTHGQALDWPRVASLVGPQAVPERIPTRPEFLWVADNRRVFAGVDAIVFGGGGLLQDSHSRIKPYQWLSYLSDAPGRPPVLAVGHGLGPLSTDWQVELRRVGNPFDESWVRDSDSLHFSRSVLDWPAELTTDFVTPDFVNGLAAEPRGTTAGHSLGVSLRAWPGLSARDVAERIIRLSQRHSCTRVEYFVLEDKGGTGPDASFTREVAAIVQEPPGQIHIYDPIKLREFVGAMKNVRISLSMKLHACVIWSAFGVPIYPIFYAPKVAAAFGSRYESLGSPNVPMLLSPPPSGVPTAGEVVRARLPFLVEAGRSPVKFRFPRRSRLIYQARRTSDSLRMRVQAIGGPR